MKTGLFKGLLRKEVKLGFLPNPDFLVFDLPQTHVTLVTNEGSTFTTEVVKILTKQGHKVVVLDVPNVTQQTGTALPKNVVNLNQNNDDAIEKAINEVQTKYGQIGSFLYLHPHYVCQNGNFKQHFTTEKDKLKMVFLLAKHLKQALNKLGEQQRANFMTVTRLDGQLGLGKRGNVSIVGGGLTGLVKSLNLEWSPVFCRAIDVQPEWAHEGAAKQVLKEWHDADTSVVEVACTSTSRQTIIAVEVETPENQMITTSVTPNDVFVVSGGAKGVTATCVVEMAKAFKCKFVLLGRSVNDFVVPNYALNEENEGALKRLIMQDLKQKGEKATLLTVKKIYKNIVAQKEITNTIQKINQYGGEAVYVKTDVTKAYEVKAKVQEAAKNLGEITGLIHGAGRLADKFIENKTAQDFDDVISVKVDGLLSMLACADINKLKHLILFSSVAGFYGNVGQTDYAMANEILSKATHLFKTNHPNAQATAINWGAWDGGMVSPALKKRFEEAGVSLVNSEGGAAMFVNEFNVKYANQAQVIIGGTLPAAKSYINDKLNNYTIKRELKAKNNAFLYDHVIQGNPVLPVVNAIGWMANVCERLFPDFKVGKIENTSLFKGIVFDGNEIENYTAQVKELSKNEQEIKLEVNIVSHTKVLPTYHYKTLVVLVPKNKKIMVPNFTVKTNNNFVPIKGHTLYTDGTLFHGKYYQGIEEVIDCNENRIVFSCKAPNIPSKDQGQFPVMSVNAFFADIQYQGIVVWAQKFKNGAKSLPLQTKAVNLYQDVPFDKTLWVCIDIVNQNDFKVMANCTVYDENGKVFMYSEDAAVTVSKELNW